MLYIKSVTWSGTVNTVETAQNTQVFMLWVIAEAYI